ncbi:MAG: epoxyqueuosine reductase QueH [Deltaproteobacteria bacterium]|nr:epoxyqueuosine reductase QueH [Deltaproteobacteria bacterium]
MKDKILLHICCAPCLIYPLKVLRESKYDVVGFFYNPNIHPYSEYKRRLETLVNYSKIVLLPLIVDTSYDVESFLEGQLKNRDERCLFCYSIRLEKAFEWAKKNGFINLTTTLLYSKYQKHEKIKGIGYELSRVYDINFLYFDFREGWQEGVLESKALNMYRQNYCGCIFSEREKFKN